MTIVADWSDRYSRDEAARRHRAQGMTALSQYDRLEAPGLFTPGKGAQRQDVILSIGSASLTITDHRDVALAHWSLAAVERLNPGRRPAIFAPGPDVPERVETSDDEMIRAIEKVRHAVQRGRPRPGRVRLRLTVAALAVVAAVAVLWLPGALTRYTASILPDAARSALGEATLARLAPLAGKPCDDPAGTAALRTLVARLGPGAPAEVRVLPASPAPAVHLVGGTVVLSRAVIEQHETPHVAAGYILAEAVRAQQSDPLLDLLSHAGLRATFTLMTTGTLPETAFDGFGERLLTRPPAAIDLGGLAARFADAGVPVAPYFDTLPSAGTEAPQGPDAGADPQALLGDGEWVALQGICAG